MKINAMYDTLYVPCILVGETPVLLVGLINGRVELIEVLRDSGASASPPDIQTTRIETIGTYVHACVHTVVEALLICSLCMIEYTCLCFVLGASFPESCSA